MRTNNVYKRMCVCVRMESDGWPKLNNIDRKKLALCVCMFFEIRVCLNVCVSVSILTLMYNILLKFLYIVAIKRDTKGMR